MGPTHISSARLKHWAFALLLGACATPAPPAADEPPAARRPIRRPGQNSGPGQAELEAAIAAAKADDLGATILNAKAAAQKNARLEQAYLLWGSACSLQDDAACEAEAYRAGLAALPRSAPLLKAKGFLLVQQGNATEAVAAYEEANTVAEGKDAEILAELGFAYAQAGKLKEAETAGAAALKQDPQCFHCAMMLGEQRKARKSYADAIAAYRQAEGLKPGDADARRGLAGALFLAGQAEESATILESLVQADPQDGRLRVQAAQVAMKLGRHADAAAHLKVVAEFNPDEPELLKMLLEAQTKAGDKTGALATQQRLKALGANK